MIDDRTAVRKDLHPYVGEFVWTQANNYFGWRSLLGEEPGSADISPYAAAARAADVSGLPATYISVGGLDLFLEENMIYADRLSRAGVPVELHIYPGHITVFTGQRMPALPSRLSTTLARRCAASCTDRTPARVLSGFHALSLSEQI
jgi:acetyl esterase/lipase